MSDSAGRRVTPRATLESFLESAPVQTSQLLAPVLRIGMPQIPGGLSEAQKVDEQKLQQLEAKRFAIGPAFEKSGVRLATIQRRRGLYEDEDFEGEYSPDDDVPEEDMLDA